MDTLITILFCTFFYLICIGLFTNYLVRNQSEKKFWYYSTCIVLVSIAGFREIGLDPDSEAYLNYYSSPDILILAEPTFALISSFARFFGNFQLVFIVYAIIGIYLKYYAIERLTQLKFLTLIAYFGSFFLLHDFTQIRAGVASGIFLLALIPLAERRFYKYMIFVAIASIFHYSALLLLPLWFLSNENLSRRWKVVLSLLIPVGILCHFLKIDIVLLAIPIETIKYKIQAYTEAREIADTSLNVFNLFYLFKYALFYVLLIFYNRIYQNYRFAPLLIKIYGISLASYLMLSQNTILAMRVSELLGIVEILLIPTLYYVFRTRLTAAIVVSLISGIYLYINIYYIVLIRDI